MTDGTQVDEYAAKGFDYITPELWDLFVASMVDESYRFDMSDEGTFLSFSVRGGDRPITNYKLRVAPDQVNAVRTAIRKHREEKNKKPGRDEVVRHQSYTERTGLPETRTKAEARE